MINDHLVTLVLITTVSTIGLGLFLFDQKSFEYPRSQWLA
jgi:hypothetical protein